MPYADLPTGIQMHYEDVGERTPIIALHGWLGTAHIDLGNVIDWLAKSYRVIGPTLRGYGESRPPQRDFPNDFYYRDAADVIALMDVLDIEKAHILGYSDGGEVALIAAGRNPHRFISVITWGSVGYFGPEMRPVVQRNAPATFLSDNPELMKLHGITNSKAFVAGWIRAIVHMIDRGGDVSLSIAPNITCPLLMMLGDQDTLNPQAYGHRFVNAAPHAQLVMFQNTGHPIHTEQWNRFQQIAGNFLNKS